MVKRLSYLLFACFMLSLTSVFGQDTARTVTEAVQQQNTETGPVNEFFRSNAKIYVPMGILVIIFIAIVLYLVRLDRRLTKLEKE
ncbi:CcmD family protein [Chitinophaga barathri]|uniref:CcmD family protein n=1 Tax=Chitinophaga barathri TaxID=1647451 RepID=A0A3N4M6H5_9BACT|nr:CcmD family protein [Chitinophaga barathri]RPD38974.1 CcmD family protein [Chitinophaga barathri]